MRRAHTFCVDDTSVVVAMKIGISHSGYTPTRQYDSSQNRIFEMRLPIYAHL